MITKQQLIAFEDEIAFLFNTGKLPGKVVHLSGGNEEQLLNIWYMYNIDKNDWVFSTWRSHYHALLKGMSSEILKQRILNGDSMHLMDKDLRFFSSAIVAGCCSIAVGVAVALKRQNSSDRVFCFIGDGAEDQGAFYEALRYSVAFDLPILFIIEDNNLSVDTTKEKRINNYCMYWPESHVIRYKYKRKYPHCQTGVFVKEYM